MVIVQTLPLCEPKSCGAPHSSSGHRSLSAYVNEATALGCRIIELCEPRLDETVAQDSRIDGIESYTQLPNFLIVAAERA